MTCTNPVELFFTQRDLQAFLARDEQFRGKTAVSVSDIRPLDSSACRATTQDGVVASGSACVDLGIEMTSTLPASSACGGINISLLIFETDETIDLNQVRARARALERERSSARALRRRARPTLRATTAPSS